jgi:hypothetical protein
MLSLLWLAGAAARDPAAPTGRRRLLERSLASAWIT